MPLKTKESEMSTNEIVTGVLTTVAPPTDCVRHLHSFCGEELNELVVVGDRKGPESYPLPSTRFLSISTQEATALTLAKLLPENHYSRKNLGFLSAISKGADVIYETDDDTMPTRSWHTRSLTQNVRVLRGKKWTNVFRFFTDEQIWPRGLPLDEIHSVADATDETQLVEAPIQQGMIDLSPDVDAVWRLVFGHEVFFQPEKSLMVQPGTWCPFNSQNTWWRPQAFPLLYLPSHCEFRATDIWRSFVAQRCLWELEVGVVFHGPDTIQHRNVHNLMTDFRGEITGYLQNQEITDLLGSLSLLPGEENVARNLYDCYEALAKDKVFPSEELEIVTGWIEDLENCMRQKTDRTPNTGRRQAA